MLQKRNLTTSLTTYGRAGKGQAYVKAMEAVVDSKFEVPLTMAVSVRNEFMYVFSQELRTQLAKQIMSQKEESMYPSDDHGEMSGHELLESLEVKHHHNDQGRETDILDIEFGEGLPYAHNINKPEGEVTIIETDFKGLIIPNRKEMSFEVSAGEGTKSVTPRYVKKASVEWPGQATFTKALQATVRKEKSLKRKAAERVVGKFSPGQKWKTVGDYAYSPDGRVMWNKRINGRFAKRD